MKRSIVVLLITLLAVIGFATYSWAPPPGAVVVREGQNIGPANINYGLIIGALTAANAPFRVDTNGIIHMKSGASIYSSGGIVGYADTGQVWVSLDDLAIDNDTTYSADVGLSLIDTAFSYSGNFAGVGGSISDAQVPDSIARDTELHAQTHDNTYHSTNYQTEDAQLTDIADGTLTGNFVNTAFPWADNEVADTISVGNSGSVALTALNQQGATSGQVIKWDGSNWAKGDASSGGLIDVQVFTANGTWTKPAGTASVTVLVIGGGGGGGAGSIGNSSTTLGQGGAAGGLVYKHITTGLGATETITIGTGGTGGSQSGGANGSIGGSSLFGLHISVSGGGGGVGNGGYPISPNTNGGVDGDSPTAGKVSVKGGASSSAFLSVTDAIGKGSDGGDTPFGMGFGGRGDATVTSAFGLSATGYGGGGGGGINISLQTGTDGGNGTDGIIIVKSYY